MQKTPQMQPSMITRSQWGAAPAIAKESCLRSNSPIYLVVHHTGDTNDNLVKNYPDEKACMKRIQQIDFDINYCDISYNYCIGINGSLLEGCDPTKEGRHTTNYNHQSIAVCVHGNYDIRNFTTTQKDMLISTLAWLCYKYNIEPSYIKGHFELNSTVCPGANIKSQLSDIRTKVTNKLYPDIINP